MKILLTLFVLLFSSSVVAENISDFEIEGISVGDSVLRYMTEEEIINEIEINKSAYSYLPEKFGEAYIFNGLKKYDFISFFIKLNDKNYISHAVSGGINYKNINKCFEKQKKIFDQLKRKFTNQDLYEDTVIHLGDQTGESKVHTMSIIFKNGNSIRSECYAYGKQYKKINNFEDSFIISIVKKEVSDWFTVTN